MKGLSPLVSVVILIVISISIASMVAPWMYELVLTTSNKTSADVQTQVMCRSAGLDFDSSYGYYGVTSNFSYNVSANETDLIKARIVNTGSVNLHTFTFEVTIENVSDDRIYHYVLTDASDVASSDPLKPGMSAIIHANVTEDFNESLATLLEVTILNPVCPGVSPSIDL